MFPSTEGGHQRKSKAATTDGDDQSNLKTGVLMSINKDKK